MTDRFRTISWNTNVPGHEKEIRLHDGTFGRTVDIPMDPLKRSHTETVMAFLDEQSCKPLGELGLIAVEDKGEIILPLYSEQIVAPWCEICSELNFDKDGELISDGCSDFSVNSPKRATHSIWHCWDDEELLCAKHAQARGVA